MHAPQMPPQPLPLSAEYENSVESKLAGATPQTTPWKLSRCSDGKSMVDYGNKTVITDPNAKQTITLDHLKKEALVTPHLPGQPNLPAMPGMPQIPSLKPPSPQAPPMDVKDLGKKMIAGHEADGKLFTFHPPQMPKMPAANLPQMPGLKPPPVPGLQPPQAPGLNAPQIPGLKPPPVPGLAAPQVPQPPGGAPPAPPSPAGLTNAQLAQMPHTVEVWTASKLHLPMMTKTTTGATQQTTTCKQVTTGEPAKCAFKIPADYKIIHPPSMPQLPKSPMKV